MPPDSQCIVRITGKVQRVKFRESTKAQARELGVRGWVRNTLDGSVEAMFQGPEDKVAALVDWCRVGPQKARVDAVLSTPAPLEPCVGFQLRDRQTAA
ncbi:MAG: acylphosphatase [Myxococcota bacterium]